MICNQLKYDKNTLSKKYNCIDMYDVTMPPSEMYLIL